MLCAERVSECNRPSSFRIAVVLLPGIVRDVRFYFSFYTFLLPSRYICISFTFVSSAAQCAQKKVLNPAALIVIGPKIHETSATKRWIQNMNFDVGVGGGGVVVAVGCHHRAAVVLLSLSLSQRHTDDYQNLHSVTIRFFPCLTFFDCITSFVAEHVRKQRSIKHLFSISATEWYTHGPRTLAHHNQSYGTKRSKRRMKKKKTCNHL